MHRLSLSLKGPAGPRTSWFRNLSVLFIFKRVYLLIFRERGKEGERKGEKKDVQEKQ